jgi:hypothetical protein
MRGVVGHIPTRSLEVQAGSSELPLQQTMALGTFFVWFRTKALDLFKFVAALSAAIRIQGQSASPPRRNLPLCLL